MKIALAFLFIFIAVTSFALDIATTDGKLYRDCEVKSVEKYGVRITHQDGTAFLDFDSLPIALQKKYSWTAEKSAARKVEKAAEVERQRIAAENARRQMEERAAAIAKAEEKQKLENKIAQQKQREPNKTLTTGSPIGIRTENTLAQELRQAVAQAIGSSILLALSLFLVVTLVRAIAPHTLGSYVRNTLLQKESVVFHSRIHSAILIPDLAKGVLVACTTAALLHDWKMDSLPLYIVSASALPALMKILTSEFAITDKRVLMKSGFISRHSQELFVNKVESVVVNQSILGRLLGYGTVIVGGTGGFKEVWPFVAKPIELRYSIQKAQNNA